MNMIGTDLYLKHTDADGRSNIQRHRVWDSALFFQTRSDECKALREKNAGAQNAVELATVTEFNKQIRR